MHCYCHKSFTNLPSCGRILQVHLTYVNNIKALSECYSTSDEYRQWDVLRLWQKDRQWISLVWLSSLLSVCSNWLTDWHSVHRSLHGHFETSLQPNRRFYSKYIRRYSHAPKRRVFNAVVTTFWLSYRGDVTQECSKNGSKRCVHGSKRFVFLAL